MGEGEVGVAEVVEGIVGGGIAPCPIGCAETTVISGRPLQHSQYRQCQYIHQYTTSIVCVHTHPLSGCDREAGLGLVRVAALGCALGGGG